jgi:Fic family protein
MATSGLTAPDLTAVRRWQRALERAQQQRFVWRTSTARMGLYSCPAPREFPALFESAARDWSTLSDPIERALFAGLAVLLIHPLTDGNGRLSRLIWREQLIVAGIPADRVDQRIAQLFSAERNEWIASMSEARRGNPERAFAQLRRGLLPTNLPARDPKA